MKKLALLLGTLLLFSTISLNSAQAEKILFFAPTHVFVTKDDPVAVLTVTNMSSIARAYSLEVIDNIMTPDGTTAPVDNFEYSAKRMIRFVPRSFIIKPGDKQTVRVMARFKGDVPDGQYHSHLSFLEDIKKRNEINETSQEQGAMMTAPLAYETLIPITISKGSISTKLSLKDSTISKSTKSRTYDVYTTIVRQGNGQGRGGLKVEYIQPDGTTLEISPRWNIIIYRELDVLKRKYEVTLPEGAQNGGKFRIKLYDTISKDALPTDLAELSLSD